MSNIGLKIRYIRKLHKMNQRQFSEAINISQGRLSEIEIGKCNPSADTLVSIAEAFDVDLNWLLLEQKRDLKPLSSLEIKFLEVLEKLPKEIQNEILEYIIYRISK
jgi:transcriptional regulator with XRE-family HTH domain